jgi:hypothetical protein
LYSPPDWHSARAPHNHPPDSAPVAAITAHGPPMRGERLQDGLRNLSAHFDVWARPERGRYRDHPAITDGSGVVELPPSQLDPKAVVLAGLAIGAAIAFATTIGRNEDEARRSEELSRLMPVPIGDAPPSVESGNGSGPATEDISLVAARLADTTSEVDAR